MGWSCNNGPPGPPGPEGSFEALETIADLRALVADEPNAVVSVKQDGRGGLFFWDDDPDVDDGGVRYNVGGVGTATAGWNRITSGAFNAAWFGLGTGDVDNATALNQTVLGALLRQAVSPDAQVSQPDILIPAGSYVIADSFDLTNYFGTVHAEAAVLVAGDPGIDMVVGIGKNLTIQGLALEGGKDGFVIDTNNLDAVVIRLEDVRTRNLNGRAIVASLDSNSSLLNVEDSRFLFEDASSEIGFDLGSIDHANFVNCWVTSARNQTWYNRSTRLRIRGCILVPAVPDDDTTDFWVTNESGSIWLFENMFSGENSRPILWSSALSEANTVRSIEVHDNILHAPATQGGRGPFKFTGIPNEISIRNNVGLAGITVLGGLGIEFSGAYAALSAQSEINLDSQWMRQFSAGSDDTIRNTMLARMCVLPWTSALEVIDAARSLELDEAGNADYGQNVSGTVDYSATTNAAGLTCAVVVATGTGQSFVLGYTSALAGLPDGCYTMLVSITILGFACEVLLEGGDVIDRKHLPQGRRIMALPFVWVSGTTDDNIQIELRDLPNGASVILEPIEVVAGVVAADAKFYATAAPTGNSGHRWLKGTVLWESNPTSGQFIGRVCTASSTRLAAKSFDAGTWKTFGAIS